jgi:putative endopeptidase
VSFGRIWASNHRPEFARLIATTNEHPLGEFRVTGSVSNMPEFAKAFSCGPTSSMVRPQFCQIW